MPTISEQIVRKSVETNYQALPEDVVEVVKSHLLDCIGIALASNKTDYGDSIHKTSLRLGMGTGATIIGFGDNVPTYIAALANGTLIHGLDFDDTHIAGIIHASAPIAAAALAIGENENAKGKIVIAAMANGLELITRLGVLVDGKLHDRGFHPTSVLGTSGASLTAGLILNLDEKQIVNALGLCGSMSSGILELSGSWLKRMHPGWAAHSGIIAAEMARDGFKGPALVFESTKGLLASHLSEVPKKLSKIVEHWNVSWETKNIALKRYPCCHFTHAFIDCAEELKKTHNFNYKEIQRIDCKIGERMVPIIFEPREVKIQPRIIYDALFSIPYVVASMLVKGKVDVSTFYDETFDDPDVLEVASRVYWENDPNSTYPAHFPGEVTIHLKNGQILNHRVDILKGEPENPLTQEEIETKFFNNATRVISYSRAKEVCDVVNHLENFSIKDLMNLLKI